MNTLFIVMFVCPKAVHRARAVIHVNTDKLAVRSDAMAYRLQVV